MITPMASARALDLTRDTLSRRTWTRLLAQAAHQCSTTWESLGLRDPAVDLLSLGNAADHAGRAAHDFLEGLARGWPRCAGPVRRGVDAGGLEQVRVLRADAVDAHQVGVVDPLEDDARGSMPVAPSEAAAPGCRGGLLEQVVGRRDA